MIKLDIRFEEPLYTVAEAARVIEVPSSTLATWTKGYVHDRTDRPAVIGEAVVTKITPHHWRVRSATADEEIETLIEMSEDVKSSHLLANFLLAAHDLNMQVHFTAVTDEEYAKWVGSQTKKRFIATILGRTITAEHLASVTEVIANAGMNIDRIDRLSGRTPLNNAENARACIEFLQIRRFTNYK